MSRRLATQLFPKSSALGQPVYIGSGPATRIIGIIDRVQTPWAGFSWAESFIENASFLPYHYHTDSLYYVVRTRPGFQARIMRGVEAQLSALSQRRVIDYLETFRESRANLYERERTASIILGTVCALLLAITAFGIVGLTTYWVGQRRRQIGMRRALGARRADILRYFHTENLLIAATGSLVGIALGYGANLWLASTLELERMSFGFICAGAALVLCLCQAAVAWPAARAAAIAPAIATRGL